MQTQKEKALAQITAAVAEKGKASIVELRLLIEVRGLTVQDYQQAYNKGVKLYQQKQAEA